MLFSIKYYSRVFNFRQITVRQRHISIVIPERFDMNQFLDL